MSSLVHEFSNYPMNPLPNELIYVSRLIFHVSTMRYSLSELVLLYSPLVNDINSLENFLTNNHNTEFSLISH